MHRNAVILLSLMLIVAPVSAQGASSPDALDRLFQFIRDVGAPWSLILLIVFVVYRLGKPGADAFVENSRARTESEKATRAALESSGKAQSDSASALKQVAEAMVDLANVNKQTMERMAEFEKRTDAAAAREETAKAINDHADETVKPILDANNHALEELRELREQLKTLVTQKQFDGAMKDMTKRLDKIITEMERNRTPNAAPEPVAETPAESPAPDGGKVEPVDGAKE